MYGTAGNLNPTWSGNNARREHDEEEDFDRRVLINV
jgi:hypothetical protein